MSDEQRPDDSAAPEALPPHLAEVLDTLDRELCSVAIGRWLKQRNLSPSIPHLALRGLQCYLGGERDRAVQIFENIAEDLRDLTMQLNPP